MSSSFIARHIGPSADEVKEMLAAVGVDSVDQLIDQTIPANIRLKKELGLPEGLSEFDYQKHINELANKNKVFKNFIGQGYYSTITPAVIQRNILENPGWYTAYTPYQAEISQGRLEGLLNFQTMVSDLTGMEIANASLLDEATAAAEAMIMLFNSRSRAQAKAGVDTFFVSNKCFAQTIEVLKTRATPLNIKLEIADESGINFDSGYFGLLLQYPAADGSIENYNSLVSNAHQNECNVVVAADLMSLSLLTPPGEWGADVVVGSTQRFGIPMGCGGPHAAYFATKESYKRSLPGRIIGVSVDAQGKPALRMALQTREQHIRRDKATSNICTAQALLAIMAGMYCVYHGKEGVQAIANKIHSKATVLAEMLKAHNIEIVNANFFDTLTIKSSNVEAIKSAAISNEVNFHYFSNNLVSINIGESTSIEELNAVLNVFEIDEKIVEVADDAEILPTGLKRTSDFFTHEVFNNYRSETEMMRYIKSLENKDISLTHSMISLGSCTMKLNAASELYPISNPNFANIHPFAPENQLEGYIEIFKRTEKWLAEITGFDAVSLQPNSGAQGEYAGLLTIKAYHENNGDNERNIALIPSSAHGTNPASAVMAGMKVVVVKCDDNGNINVTDLKEKAEKFKDTLSCLMVTYPSTHGVFEESIVEITSIIHVNGGLVYMDGANMNAQVGLTNPGNIGADVCHLNLHKTFAIPHGGGGPGMGPIGVNNKLAPFLPTHSMQKVGGEKGISSVSAAPYGSGLITLISYGYLKMLGKTGIKQATEMAILNANYMKSQLEKGFKILYTGPNGRVAHEMILECRDFKKSKKVEVADIAKRLIDYGFHAPTVSFPVAGTLMIEPTESESKYELDRFCEAMLSIKAEIDAIENEDNNLLKNAPHTAEVVTSDNWDYNYSRKEAAYPLSWLYSSKYWVPVSRVDNAHGDRNLICTCPSVESYQDELAEA